MNDHKDSDKTPAPLEHSAACEPTASTKDLYPLFEWAPDGRNIIIRDIEVIQMIIDYEYEQGRLEEGSRLLLQLKGEKALK